MFPSLALLAAGFGHQCDYVNPTGNNNLLAIAASAAILALCGAGGAAQDRDRSVPAGPTSHEQNQQLTRDWYHQHRSNPPAGLRDRDRLSADQESRMEEGKMFDKDMRKQAHPAPPELTRQLPRLPMHQRYVAIGGHIAAVDSGYHVKTVIHLHGN